MTQSAVVRACIDERTKDEAAAVLQAMGLTVSDAFRLMMVRIAAGLPRFDSIDALLADLNADD